VVQVIFGFNEPIWVFQIQYNLPHIAKKVIRKEGWVQKYKIPPREAYLWLIPYHLVPPRTFLNL